MPAARGIELHEGTLKNINHRFGPTPAIDTILGLWVGADSKGEGAE